MRRFKRSQQLHGYEQGHRSKVPVEIPIKLSADTVGTIGRIMTDTTGEVRGSHAPLDLLPGQVRLSSFTEALAKVDIGGDRPPDTLIFTRYSAIPTADAFRGAYAALGEPLPTIGIAKVNGDLKYAYQRDPIARQEEVARLATFVGNNVVIVDQAAIFGTALECTDGMVREAGAENVTLVPGWWYSDVNRSEVDPNGVTSQYAHHFFTIGEASARSLINE